MKVCLYKGSLSIVAKSGVGQAIAHQEAMLRRTNVEPVAHIWNKCSYVHINTVFPDAPLAALFARLTGRSVIYYGHSTMEDFRNSFKGSNALAPLFRLWIKFCYQTGNIIITPSEYSKALLQSYGIVKPIYALSNGVDTDFFAPDAANRAAFRRRYNLSDDQRVVISVGHHIARKGVQEFVELARSMPDTRFIWFGYTDPHLIPAEISAAIAAAPENLAFPGFVSQAELRDAYCGADAFVFMSHEETEGIVVLEALAAGIPTIVRDIPVYNGWLENGKNVYKATDFSEFQTLTQQLINGKLPDLRTAGRQTALDRSIYTCGKKLLGIYQSAAEHTHDAGLLQQFMLRRAALRRANGGK